MTTNRLTLVVYLTGLAIASLLTGCESWRQYVANGFKVGPNYSPVPARVAPNWIDQADPKISSALASVGLSSPSLPMSCFWCPLEIFTFCSGYRAFAYEAPIVAGFVSAMNADDGIAGNSSAPVPSPWPTSSATERDGHTPRRLSPHGPTLSSDQA